MMRHLGLTLLGLIGGLLAGVVLQDVLAPVLVSGGEVNALGLVLLPVLLPISGLAGAGFALTLSLSRRSR
ncbi:MULTISPECIES: hypothetical protein [Brachybacterium]|uniref:hypothetical protein n=1 Tax=Brachybacterium TaxID=43668 RepID=UPI000DF22879|nr:MULTISPECIES: hypothetical protein [Brachybacterium]RCS65617.1 hypothetical protein CIK81_05365 [Brachybacterium sp. JB7]RCS78506.1 hypothetical protein CIK72_12105 [Brachybacterium alimentarium]